LDTARRSQIGARLLWCAKGLPLLPSDSTIPLTRISRLALVPDKPCSITCPWYARARFGRLIRRQLRDLRRRKLPIEAFDKGNQPGRQWLRDDVVVVVVLYELAEPSKVRVYCHISRAPRVG
jgi:hypothetical protein